MDHTAQFEVLVVDEAAQSVEVSTIIPLRCDNRATKGHEYVFNVSGLEIVRVKKRQLRLTLA